MQVFSNHAVTLIRHAIAELTLDGPVQPKARPRLTKSGKAYLPKEYRQWQADAIAALAQQWAGQPTLNGPLAIGIGFEGKHSRRADLDNLAGAVVDALTKSKILRSDNCTVVTQLFACLLHGDAPPKTIIKLDSVLHH